MQERVLVFPAILLNKLGHFCGFSNQVDNYLPTLLDPMNLQFLARAQAEDDPTYKQLVPYAVLRCDDQVFTYERGKKGSEGRLHHLLSLGVGGHICDDDGVEGSPAYDRGFQRELEEEVAIESPYEQKIVGMVHDDRTPVGAVHFGIVHELKLQAPRVHHRDPALANARFRPLEELRRLADRMESWSAFVLSHVLA